MQNFSKQLPSTSATSSDVRARPRAFENLTCMHQAQQNTQYLFKTVNTHFPQATMHVQLGNEEKLLFQRPKQACSLLSSPSCRKLLSQASKTPALAENFCSKPKRPATNQILLRTAKTSQDCRKLRKLYASRGYSHRTNLAAQRYNFSHPLSMQYSHHSRLSQPRSNHMRRPKTTPACLFVRTREPTLFTCQKENMPPKARPKSLTVAPIQSDTGQDSSSHCL